jgi:hypothetical protein
MEYISQSITIHREKKHPQCKPHPPASIHGRDEESRELASRRLLDVLRLVSNAALKGLKVLSAELVLNRFEIANRINRIVNVNDCIVLKRSNNVVVSVGGLSAVDGKPRVCAH